MTPFDENIDSFAHVAKELVRPVRNQVRRHLRMRERRLANGALVRFTFDTDFGVPHFEFFSHELSPTGYRSDFFGRYGEELTESEIAEAFDYRANEFSRQNKAEMLAHAEDLAKVERRRVREERERETVELPLSF